MQRLRLIFSTSGRLAPPPFVFSAIVVYAVGLASQWLTVPNILARAGLAPFAIVQALLIWVWIALHAKRLRDCGRPIGLAVGIGLLYALSVVLLLIVANAFFDISTTHATDANTTSALGLLMLAFTIATLLGSPHYDVTWLLVAVLTVIALAPIVLAVGLTLWAATRPRREDRTA